ncbi:hypothetical protein K439DRAFT_1647835 [Ramaria rubella]|nr:hypothetical protein K439DRAFT_1647835 [Ramaria rubella]
MTHVSIVPTGLPGSNVPTVPLSTRGSRKNVEFLRLPHPRTGVPSLFFTQINHTVTSEIKSQSFILEVQTIAPHSSRSWFLEGDQVVAVSTEVTDALLDGKLLVMAPIDPAFLLLPILQVAQPLDGSIGNFRPPDDIFEEAAARLSQGSKSCTIKSKDVLQLAALDCVHAALKRICDYKEITEEISVYRLSPTKLLQMIAAKVARLSQSSVFDQYPSLRRQLARDGLSLLNEEKDELRQACRTRIVCEFLSQYLPPDVSNDLLALYDFTALDTHVRSLVEDITTLAPRHPVLPPKGDNDKKRKATSQLSKGVSKLMKVNTSGMHKISSFFKKPAK